MKTVVAFLILSLVSVPALACWNSLGTCTSAGGGAGTGCQSPGGASARVCFINVNSVGCYIITNSSGSNVFIPTNSVSEFNAFLAHPPAGMTATAGTVGSNCFPSCYKVVGNCSTANAGSLSNPP